MAWLGKTVVSSHMAMARWITHEEIKAFGGWGKDVADQHYMQGAQVPVVLACAGFYKFDRNTITSMYFAGASPGCCRFCACLSQAVVAERFHLEIDNSQLKDQLAPLLLPPLPRLRWQMQQMQLAGRHKDQIQSVQHVITSLEHLAEVAVRGAVEFSLTHAAASHPLVQALSPNPYFQTLQRSHANNLFLGVRQSEGARPERGCTAWPCKTHLATVHNPAPHSSLSAGLQQVSARHAAAAAGVPD